MNDALEEFFATRLSRPGLAAYGLRLPDRSVHHKCLTNWIAPSQIEPALNRLMLAADNLRNHQLQPVTLYWTFERLRLYAGFRPDGACLVLFLENSAIEAAPHWESTLRDFMHG